MHVLEWMGGIALGIFAIDRVMHHHREIRRQAKAYRQEHKNS